jgi:hypothetical protein
VRLAAALAARSAVPPLVPDRPWDGCPELTRSCAAVGKGQTLRVAAAVIADRPEEALADAAIGGNAGIWRAVALRRCGRFGAARQAFRCLGTPPEYAHLYREALAVLRSGGAGFRWATESVTHLAARGKWDPVWFVDACAAAHAGLLSRETAALLEEIQRAELQLLLRSGAAGQT